jgi:hypothetical protein
MKAPRIRVWFLLVAVAIIAGLLALGRGHGPPISASDLIVVEVEPNIPGRPISNGQRMVHPGGDVSLGEFGNVVVAGLSPEEAEVKIAAHLRRSHSTPMGRVTVRNITIKTPPCPIDAFFQKIRNVSKRL